MLDKLNFFVEKEIAEEKETFKITDDNKADWALSKIAENNAEIDRVKEFAKQRIEQIKRWEEAEIKSKVDNNEYFEGLLQGYLIETKKKSIKLPTGSINFRKQQPQWQYDDEKVLKSLEDAGLNEFIRVKKEVNKVDLKKSVEVAGDKVVSKETGEIIDGVTIVKRDDKFNVKVN